jgi:hypothetical protein
VGTSKNGALVLTYAEQHKTSSLQTVVQHKMEILRRFTPNVNFWTIIKTIEKQRIVQYDVCQKKVTKEIRWITPDPLSVLATHQSPSLTFPQSF